LLLLLQEAPGRFAWAISAAALVLTCGIAFPAAGQDGTLETIRQDVRDGVPQAPAAPAPQQNSHNSSGNYDWSDPAVAEAGEALGTAAVLSAAAAVVTPFVGPMVLLDDKITKNGHFLCYPYDPAGSDGYIEQNALPGLTRPWSARVDVEYVETFDQLENMGGHLLLDTASRIGLAASLEHLEERPSSGARDEMSIGDWNLVWRFAQGKLGEFHTGVGMNWLNDSGGTNAGFNFTYGADFYPVKPWIICTSLDCGTLGRADLFRFRTTVGLEFHGVETYVGYEYTDIGCGRWNGLIGGLRLWF
jgi:hypothetical protein